MQTESEFRRRLAAALTGTGLAACGEQGPAVSAVLAEARAAGLELAPDLPGKISIHGKYLVANGDFWATLETESYYDAIPMARRELIAKAAIQRYAAFPALEARAARLAAALGELLALAEAQGGLEAERLRRAVAEGRAALAEGEEP